MKGPVPHARIQELEKRVTGLLAIAEKQNESQAALEKRVAQLEQQLNTRPPVQTPSDGYQPVFDRWPGNGR